MDIDVAHSPIDGLAETVQQYHDLIVAGDRTAPSRIAFACFGEIVRRLRRAYASIDPHMVDISVADAFMGYLQHPDRYKPEKSSLFSYLMMSARGDLRNLIKREGKRAEHEQPLSVDVEDDGDRSELEVEPVAPDDVEAEVLAAASQVAGLLDDLFPDPSDRLMVDMMLDGIRETSEYSALLGLGHLSEQEQADEVKRRKDRIKKKLQRKGEALRGAIHDD